MKKALRTVAIVGGVAFVAFSAVLAVALCRINGEIAQAEREQYGELSF